VPGGGRQAALGPWSGSSRAGARQSSQPFAGSSRSQAEGIVTGDRACRSPVTAGPRRPHQAPAETAGRSKGGAPSKARLPDEVLDRRWRLLAPYRGEIVDLVQRKGLPLADAEDCAHEALLRVVTFGALDERRAVPLLKTVASRLVIDAYRQRVRDARARVRLHLEPEPALPEEAVLDKAEAQWLAARMSELPTRERDVIAVRLQGNSPVEAARQLGITVKAAETAFRRARIHLRLLAVGAAALLTALVRRVARITATPSIVTISAAGLILMIPAPAATQSASGTGGVAGDQRLASGTGSPAARSPAPPTVGTSVPASSDRFPGAAAALGNRRSVNRPVVRVTFGQPDSAHGSLVRVERRDEHESFLQSLQRCLREGVQLTGPEFGCRP